MNTIWKRPQINLWFLQIFETVGMILLLLLGGCAYYSFSGNTLPSYIKTVAIPLFEDQTSEFGIKERLTDALISEFTRDNTLKISSQDEADSIIRGKILSVVDRAETYDAQEHAQSYRVYISVEVKFEDLRKHKVLWKQRMNQWGSYSLADESRQQGIEQAIKKLAEDILNKSVSGW